MLHTIWLVLQILLITVIILLALAVVVILLILFVPVRYHLYGEKHENIKAQARISWLSFVLCFRAYYDYDGLKYNLKTFGGTLINSDIKKEAVKDDIEDAAEDTASDAAEITIEPDTNNSDTDTENGSKEEENKEIVHDQDFKIENPGILNRIGRILDRFLAAVKNRLEKIAKGYKSIKNKNERWKKFLRSSNTKKAWNMVKEIIIKLLNHIKPTKIKGQVTYGTGDPASTGTHLGYMSIALPFYYDKIDITPDFYNKILDGEIYIRGRVRVINILSYALKILLNKYVRKAVKQFKSISGGNSNGKQ